MKKIMFCIGIVSILVFPLCAAAWDEGIVDVKGYGDQTASYSTGVVDVTSYIKTNSSGYTKDWTGFANFVGTDPTDPCPNGNCGMGITQGNYSYESYNTSNNTTVTQKALIGSGDMNSLGGLAACYDGYIDFDGNLHQTHTVNNVVNGPLGGGINGTATYTGVQTLNLTVGK